MNLPEIIALDTHDPLKHMRENFYLNASEIYMCGHSLGPQSKSVQQRVEALLHHEWKAQQIRAWNDWIHLPQALGGKLARLLGASADEVIVTDSLTVNLFKVLSAAVQLRRERSIILTTEDNFPADLYMLESIKMAFPHLTIKCVKETEVELSLTDEVAVVLLTHVNYKTAAILDMKRLTYLAHQKGALIVWDLAHSTGILPVELNAHEVDFAVGCTYKYLNGGPGAPGFLFVASRHQNAVTPLLSGWMGHANPFAFEAKHTPAEGVRRYLCGTPSIISMVALEGALELMESVDIGTVRHKSQQLGTIFQELVQLHCPQLTILSPQDETKRGGHVAMAHPHGFAISKALLERGVIADFRAPDVLRFGLSPLYLRYQDIYQVVMILADVLNTQIYLQPRFTIKTIIT